MYRADQEEDGLDCGLPHIRGSECSTREDEEEGIAYVSMAYGLHDQFLGSHHRP